MATNNVTTITLIDGREVLLSYGTPVAAFIPGRGYLKTSRKWSVTTSKHATQYAGKAAPEVTDPEFLTLIAPVDGGPGRR